MTVRTLPRLHVVTDDRVLASPGFLPLARAMLEAGVALHLRAPGMPARQLLETGRALGRERGRGRVSGASPGALLVNDRVDVALALGPAATGVHLPARGLPAQVARRMLGPGAWLGRSIRGSRAPGLVATPEVDLDYLLVGTLFSSASHPGRDPDGIQALERVRDAQGPAGHALPLVAIGGITVERVPEVLAAGAHGVAALGGIWNARDPVEATASYLDALVPAPVGPDMSRIPRTISTEVPRWTL